MKYIWIFISVSISMTKFHMNSLLLGIAQIQKWKRTKCHKTIYRFKHEKEQYYLMSWSAIHMHLCDHETFTFGLLWLWFQRNGTSKSMKNSKKCNSYFSHRREFDFWNFLLSCSLLGYFLFWMQRGDISLKTTSQALRIKHEFRLDLNSNLKPIIIL